MSVIPVSVPTKRLATAITAGQLTMQLNNILDWKGSALTSADFGTQAFGVFRNADNTQIEFFEWDPATVASASITILKRGLGYGGNTTASEETAYAWNANETLVELGSTFPQLFKQLVDTASAQTIGGVKTFSSLPGTTAGNPVLATDLARKAYVDSVVAGIATTVSVVVPGTAGETLAAGNLVYFDDTENEWMKCDADTAATVENSLLGIAQGAGTNGAAITGGVMLQGLDANQTGLTASALYYASNTAGGISSSAGTKEVTVGFSYSTTQLYFNPRFNQQLTEDQQDALASTTALSATNKVVSQKDFQIGAEVYAASAAGSDTYAITLSPAPSAYVNGMMLSFKADVANTGAATLNVNALGAVDITKLHDQALATGDIEANQIVTVIYNSSTAKFQMVSPVASSGTTFTNGTTTYDVSTADGTQAIAHGLGATPKKIRITILENLGADGPAITVASYNGTTASVVGWDYINGAGEIRVGTTIKVGYTTNNTIFTTGTVTFDGTNINIAWVKTGSPTGTLYMMWEAEG